MPSLFKGEEPRARVRSEQGTPDTPGLVTLPLAFLWTHFHAGRRGGHCHPARQKLPDIHGAARGHRPGLRSSPTDREDEDAQERSRGATEPQTRLAARTPPARGQTGGAVRHCCCPPAVPGGPGCSGPEDMCLSLPRPLVPAICKQQCQIRGGHVYITNQNLFSLLRWHNKNNGYENRERGSAPIYHPAKLSLGYKGSKKLFRNVGIPRMYSSRGFFF